MIDPVFAGIIGHETVLSVLTQAAHQPAPAYLLTGPDGVGKRLIAERFARLLLDQPSDQPLDAHPDFARVQIEEGARELNVKQARALVSRMQLTAARGKRKVALIEQADRFGDEGANALLKAIEDPLGDATFLFVAEQPDRLPATIRSRTVTVHVERVRNQTIKDWLIAQGNTETLAEDMTVLAQGCPGLAKRYEEDASTWQERQQQIKKLMTVLATGSAGLQIQELERMAKTMESQPDPEQAWRECLLLLMRSLRARWTIAPEETTRLAHGLCHAWQLAGSSLSPRLALEWSALQPYLIEDLSIPSFLTPSYL